MTQTTPTTRSTAPTQEQRSNTTAAGATTTGAIVSTTTRKASRNAEAPVTPDGDVVGSAHGPYLLPALPDGPFVIKPEDVERLEVSIMPDGVLFVRGTRANLEAFVAACQAEGIRLIIDHASMCG